MSDIRVNFHYREQARNHWFRSVQFASHVNNARARETRDMYYRLAMRERASAKWLETLADLMGERNRCPP
jgi:hypothetical protein